MLIEILAKEPLKTYATGPGGRFIPKDDLRYTKVNKQEVTNLAMAGSFKGGRLSVSWIDPVGRRQVRFYKNPTIMHSYNKRRTKERITILGDYERTIIK